MKLDGLEKRARALTWPEPPTYEQFLDEWGRMDGLSKSLLELSMECPAIVGAVGPYWEAVRGHMVQMGIAAPEPKTIDEYLRELE